MNQQLPVSMQAGSKPPPQASVLVKSIYWNHARTMKILDWVEQREITNRISILSEFPFLSDANDLREEIFSSDANVTAEKIRARLRHMKLKYDKTKSWLKTQIESPGIEKSMKYILIQRLY